MYIVSVCVCVCVHVSLLLCFISCPQIATKNFCTNACAAHFVLAKLKVKMFTSNRHWIDER